MAVPARPGDHLPYGSPNTDTHPPDLPPAVVPGPLQCTSPAAEADLTLEVSFIISWTAADRSGLSNIMNFSATQWAANLWMLTDSVVSAEDWTLTDTVVNI